MSDSEGGNPSMHRRRFLQTGAAGGLSLLLNKNKTPAEEPKALTQEETDTVRLSLSIIRKRQMTNGAFNMRWKRDPKDEGEIKGAEKNRLTNPNEDPESADIDTLRVIPYFATHGALALLAAHERGVTEEKEKDEDLKRVAKWIKFYIDHQNPKNGYITDFTGSMKSYTDAEKNGEDPEKLGAFKPKMVMGKNKQMVEEYDSIDSYASTLLQLLDKWHTVTSKLPKKQREELNEIISPGEPEKAPKRIRNSAHLALRAIKSVMDTDHTAKDMRELAKRTEDVLQNGKIEPSVLDRMIDMDAAKLNDAMRREEDSLTNAKQSYMVKYLFDNVEVYGGLKAGEHFLSAIGEENDARHFGRLADAVGKQLHKTFWMPEPKNAAGKRTKDIAHFSWAKHQPGRVPYPAPDVKAYDKVKGGYREQGLADSYPHVLAQLGGLAWISNDSKAHQELWAKLKKDNLPDEAAPDERWAMAAIAMNDTEALKGFKAGMLQDAKGFDDTTNMQRPAVVALATLEGRQWMPNVATDLKPKEGPARK